VGTTPYKNRITAPENAKISALPSRSHNHIRYPPPISKMPARINRKMVYIKHLFLETHSDSFLTMSQNIVKNIYKYTDFELLRI
jgi:hypothetical protein